ncbi:MAG: CopG family transcriptional regulator [Burkholderiales bacterium]
MDSQKRVTVYFDADVHRALRFKAAAMDRSISNMVNDAVKAALAEDAEDLAAFSERKNERNLSFDTFVQGLRRRGRI